MTGNGTKGWGAYCVEDKTMVFLKEQWRVNAPGAHPEVETYKRLHRHDVRNVATAIAGGDVLGPHGYQTTLSQRIFDKEGVEVPERIQTRLVLREFGRPLETYEGPKELINVTTHALIGTIQYSPIMPLLIPI